MGWLSGDRIVLGSTEAASPNGGALHWTVTETRGGQAAVTIGLRSRIPGCEFPHLTAAVLRSPSSGSTGEWTPVDRLVGEAEDGSQTQVLAPMLLPPIVNLTVGQKHIVSLPVGAVDVVALAFGSLTNRLWFENDRHYLWLVNHDRGPTLHDWAHQVGTDPLVRRGRLVVAPDGIRIDPIDEVRLSES